MNYIHYVSKEKFFKSNELWTELIMTLTLTLNALNVSWTTWNLHKSKSL